MSSLAEGRPDKVELTAGDIVAEVTRIFENHKKFEAINARRQRATEKVWELLRSNNSSGEYETTDDVPAEIVDEVSLASLELLLAEAAYTRHVSPPNRSGSYFDEHKFMGTHVEVRTQPVSGHIEVIGFDWQEGDKDFVVKDMPDVVRGVIKISKRADEGIIELRQDGDDNSAHFVNVALLDNDGNLQVELSVLEPSVA